jgi:hypothetical protein
MISILYTLENLEICDFIGHKNPLNVAGEQVFSAKKCAFFIKNLLPLTT